MTAGAMPVSIYLDWNATSPPAPEVVRAMAEVAERAWANPASTHAAGRAALAVVEAARESIAGLLRWEPRDVILTSGGTEANNLALRGVPGLALGRLEHPSVTAVGEMLERAEVPVRWFGVSPSGRVDPEAVREALADLPRSSTVALMAVNHETGVRQPVAQVAEVTRAAGARLHVDAVQAVGKADPELWAAADSVTVAAHKIRGPKGIGALAWSGPPPSRVLVGGSQERGARPGTVDAVACAGFHAAAERAVDGPERHQRLRPLRDRLEAALSLHGTVNGTAERLGHVTNLSIAGWRGDELVAAADLAGVRMSSGSACSAGTTEASPVIEAMHGIERARSAVRISLGELTTGDEVDSAISELLRILGAHPSSA